MDRYAIWELYRSGQNGRMMTFVRRGMAKAPRGGTLEAAIRIPVPDDLGAYNDTVALARNALAYLPPRGPDRLPLTGTLDEVISEARKEARLHRQPSRGSRGPGRARG